MDIFAKAAKKKIRFSSRQGNLSAEDLWDLQLTDLDKMAVALDKSRQSGNKSFINDKSAVNLEIDLKFDLVKFVIDYKLAAQEKASKAAVTKEKKRMLKDLLEKKKMEGLESLSVEELEKQLAEA